MKDWMPTIVGCLLCLCVLPPAAAWAAGEYGLDDLYAMALAQSEKVRLSAENVAIAETTREKAFSVLIPKFSAYTGFNHYTRSKTSASGALIQPDDSSSWGLRVDQSMSLSGKEFTALRMTGENIEKVRMDLRTAQEDLLLAVAQGYFDVLRAAKEAEIAEANLGRLREHRNAAEKRLKVGEVTKTVLLRAEGELSGAFSDRVRALNAVAFARSQLARITGIQKDFRLREPAGAQDEIPPVSALQERALTHRSDIQALALQKRLAEGQIAIAEGNYWPSVSLSGVYAGADQSPATSSLNRESTYAGVALTFPFYEGGLRTAEVKEAKARDRQAALQLEDAKKTVTLDVQGVYLDLMTQKGILEFLEDQLAYAKDNYHAVSRQFAEGLANSIDVMDANTLLVSAERKRVGAAYQYQVSLLRMKRATGTFLREIVGGPPAPAGG